MYFNTISKQGDENGESVDLRLIKITIEQVINIDKPDNKLTLYTYQRSGYVDERHECPRLG